MALLPTDGFSYGTGEEGQSTFYGVTSAAPATSFDLNQSGAAAEAALVQGGYDAAIADAVAASVGVGGDPELTQQAAVDFARQAAEAVRNGIPLDQIRFDDPNLNEQAKAAIYQAAAVQQGTSAEQVAQQAREQAEKDMAAVQGLMGGLFAGAVAYGVAAEAGKGLANTSVTDLGLTTAALAEGHGANPTQGLPVIAGLDLGQGAALG